MLKMEHRYVKVMDSENRTFNNPLRFEKKLNQEPNALVLITVNTC